MGIPTYRPDIDNQLKPCPVCGGDNIHYEEREYIECRNCGAKLEWEELTDENGKLLPEDYIVDSWNYRPDVEEIKRTMFTALRMVEQCTDVYWQKDDEHSALYFSAKADGIRGVLGLLNWREEYQTWKKEH